MKYRRLRKNVSPRIKALADAQKIAFAPLTFQAVAAALDFGILKFIDGKFVTVEEVIKVCKISKYTAETILEVCVAADIVKKKNDKYSNTLLADALLNNEMTIKNFNFVKDVCYLGASELRNSFEKEEPIGLYKFVEKCNMEDREFHLSYLFDEEIDRDGASPARVMGIYDEEEWKSILLGLSARYNEFINATFTNDLKTITLKDKTSADVLKLFKEEL